MPPRAIPSHGGEGSMQQQQQQQPPVIINQVANVGSHSHAQEASARVMGPGPDPVQYPSPHTQGAGPVAHDQTSGDGLTREELTLVETLKFSPSWITEVHYFRTFPARPSRRHPPQ